MTHRVVAGETVCRLSLGSRVISTKVVGRTNSTIAVGIGGKVVHPRQRPQEYRLFDQQITDQINDKARTIFILSKEARSLWETLEEIS